MTKAGDLFVRSCLSLRSIPSAFLCILTYVTQCGVIDYYIFHYMGRPTMYWLAVDFVNIVIFIVSIRLANSSLKRQRLRGDPHMTTLGWLAWLCSGIANSIKVIIIFYNVSEYVEEDGPSFFGSNTMKTGIGMGSLVFLLLLTTQHDAPPGSDRRRYIDELTGTVVFDLLDTVDILEILFDEESREELWPALEEFILAVGSFNLCVPALPLFTLSRTKFGKDKLGKDLVYLHRIAVVLMVNVPNLLVRMILWHGFSVGVTPFTLKNIILIGLVLFEFYEHKLMKYEMHRADKNEEGSNDHDGEADKASRDENGTRHRGSQSRGSPERLSEEQQMAVFSIMERDMMTVL